MTLSKSNLKVIIDHVDIYFLHLALNISDELWIFRLELIVSPSCGFVFIWLYERFYIVPVNMLLLRFSYSILVLILTSIKDKIYFADLSIRKVHSTNTEA